MCFVALKFATVSSLTGIKPFKELYIQVITKQDIGYYIIDTLINLGMHTMSSLQD